MEASEVFPTELMAKKVMNQGLEVIYLLQSLLDCIFYF